LKLKFQGIHFNT